jgi:hypothetical protein
MNAGQVTSLDPQGTLSGMVNLQLDPRGRLLRFTAIPNEIDPAAASPHPADWAPLFAAAGLDEKEFKPANPEWTPLATSDARAAWTGPGSLRVEAASWKGKPVFFQVIGPWTHPGRQDAPALSSSRMAGIILGLLALSAILIGACVLARRNVRLGRGDRRGAMRLASVLFLLTVGGWALGAHHVDTFDEFALMAQGMSQALMIAALVWLFYIAVEPYVRRRWPQTMISWGRILEGRWRDPLVASHVLIGIATGCLMVGCISAMQLMEIHSGGAPGRFLDPSLLNGPFEWLSFSLNRVPGAVLEALADFLGLFLLRTMLRKEWLAAGTFVLLTTAFAVLFLGVSNWSVVPLRGIEYLLMVAVLMNFGLVSIAVANLVIGFLPDHRGLVGLVYRRIVVSTGRHRGFCGPGVLFSSGRQTILPRTSSGLLTARLQLRQLLIQMRQGILEHRLVSGIPGGFEVVQNASPRKLQALPFSLKRNLLFALDGILYLYFPNHEPFCLQYDLFLIRDSDAIGQRQQAGKHAWIRSDFIVQGADGHGVRILRIGVHHLAGLQHVIEGHQTALPKQVQRTFVIVVVAGLVGVDESEVESARVAAVDQCLQSIRRRPDVQFYLVRDSRFPPVPPRYFRIVVADIAR